MTRKAVTPAAMIAVTAAALAVTAAALTVVATAAVSPDAPAPVTGGRVHGTVAIARGAVDGPRKSDASGVVIYLEAPMDPELEDMLLDNPPALHEVRQVNKQFVPAVSAVIRGTEVGFPNDDMIFHNVFSLSKSKRFDLGLYKSGTSKSVTLTRPGIIDVYCNIHPEMAAKILVLDNPFFAVTGPDGSFTIEGVPPGSYPYVAWQSRGEPVRGTVEVTDAGTVRVDPLLVETPQATLHTRKDGSPYGRYN